MILPQELKNFEDVEVLILCGGKGTRLSSVISDVPKPMAPINERPFLELLIESIRSQGLTQIKLLVGFKNESIENYFGDGSKFGVKISYSVESTPLGTGGAIHQAMRNSTFHQFLIFNGDTLFEADLPLMMEFCLTKKFHFCIALKYLENCSRYGQVEIDKNYNVTAFTEKGTNVSDGYINAGIYFCTRDLLNQAPKELASFSLEQDIMPYLVSKKKLNAIPMGGKFLDIGVPEDFLKAQTFLPQFKFINRTPALFLDRDGVIIKDTGYLSNITDVELYEEIIPIIQNANQNKIPVFIITNQAGVAHGFFSMQRCDEINQFVIGRLKDKGAIIQSCYSCPFHPNAKILEYKKDSLQRKPNPGMILLAQEELSIDLNKSMMIGDKITDIIALPGLESVLINRNYDLKNPPSDIKIFTSANQIPIRF